MPTRPDQVHHVSYGGRRFWAVCMLDKMPDTPPKFVEYLPLARCITIGSFLRKAFNAPTPYFSLTGEGAFKAYTCTPFGKSYALITGSSGGTTCFQCHLSRAYPKRGIESGCRPARQISGADVHSVVLNCATATAKEAKKAPEPLLALHIRTVMNNVGGNPIGPLIVCMVLEYSAHVTQLTLPITIGNAKSDGDRSLRLTTGSPGRAGLP